MSLEKQQRKPSYQERMKYYEEAKTPGTTSKSGERGMNFSSMEWTFLVQKDQDT